ncbi:MAG TPA: hypothetical protein VE029_10325, partial [Rhizobacter sp.]|nr:hypothetical protein [Rhizobacter sp.]
NSQQFIGSEAGQLRTQTGISAWQMYYYYNGSNGWSNAQSSAGTASPSGSASAPAAAPTQVSTSTIAAVRLVLSFGEGSDFNGGVVREIALGPQ